MCIGKRFRDQKSRPQSRLRDRWVLLIPVLSVLLGIDQAGAEPPGGPAVGVSGSQVPSTLAQPQVPTAGPVAGPVVSISSGMGGVGDPASLVEAYQSQTIIIGARVQLIKAQAELAKAQRVLDQAQKGDAGDDTASGGEPKSAANAGPSRPAPPAVIPQSDPVLPMLPAYVEETYAGIPDRKDFAIVRLRDGSSVRVERQGRLPDGRIVEDIDVSGITVAPGAGKIVGAPVFIPRGKPAASHDSQSIPIGFPGIVPGSGVVVPLQGEH